MQNSEYAKFVRSIDMTENKAVAVGIIHHVLSLGSESGEIAGKVTKQFYRGKNDDFLVFRNKLVDETSDVLFHLVALCNTLGLTMEELAEYNHKKLPDKWD